MPAHVAVAVATLVVSAVAALIALAYAGARPARRALRWPLLVTSVAALGLVIAAADAGSALLNAVQASAGTAEAAAAQAHAHGSNNFAIAVFVLLVAVLATVWSVLGPSRERWGAGMRIGAVVVAVAAVATIATGGLTLHAALQASALAG